MLIDISGTRLILLIIIIFMSFNIPSLKFSKTIYYLKANFAKHYKMIFV